MIVLVPHANLINGLTQFKYRVKIKLKDRCCNTHNKSKKKKKSHIKISLISPTPMARFVISVEVFSEFRVTLRLFLAAPLIPNAITTATSTRLPAVYFLQAEYNVWLQRPCLSP